ncbi:MAG TPA: sugar ABC transporter ATP-binding protein [Bauldia sp.]|nr:sugar ABC transporter ATP-binding protein [Bauldia sp.]
MSSTLTANGDPVATGADHSAPASPGAGPGRAPAMAAAKGDAAPPGGAALLELRNLTKSFGATLALRDIDLTLDAGKFHALLGENGAGKSTLIKILAGIFRPTRGEVFMEGRHIEQPTPALLRALGLHIVHQDSSILPGLTVAENFALGQEPTSGPGFIRRRSVRAELAARGKRFGVEFDPGMKAGRLAIGDRKILEILKVLDERQKLLILDEPTASFTAEEVRRLLAILTELKAQGTAILYVTHRLEEIEGMVDRVMVLRDGAKVGDLTRDEAGQERVVSLMVGRELGHMYPPGATATGPVLASVAGIGRPGAFEDVSFDVRRGEIVALVGLAGHGSFEVARSICGLPPPETGTVAMDGKAIRLRSLRDALKNGIGFLAEDRADTILRVRTVRENLALGALEMWSRMGFVDTRREADEANRLIKALSVRCRSPGSLAESLSGGNQQKLALGRWLAAERRLLVLLDPTAGVDVGARAEIYRHLREFAEGGRGVLVATSDLAEALGLADRVIAFYRGRQVATFPRENRREEDVLAAITGHRAGRTDA